MFLFWGFSIPLLHAQNPDNEWEVNFSLDEPEDAVKRIDSLKRELMPGSEGPKKVKFSTLYELAKAHREAHRNDSTELLKGLNYIRAARDSALAIADTNAYIDAISMLEWYYRRFDELKDSIRFTRTEQRRIQARRGYRLPNAKAYQKQENAVRIQRSFEILHDSSGTLGLAEVQDHVGFRPAYDEDNPQNEAGAWWIRFRLKSRDNRPVEHTFYLGEGQEKWDSIHIYHWHEGEFHTMLTGEALPDTARLMANFSNHFRLSVPANSDRAIYIRAKGGIPANLPNRIRIHHVNVEAELLEKVVDRHIHGIFQGIVLIQLFFFLLLYLTTRDSIYGYYAIYILGLVMFILTVNYFDDFSGLHEGYEIAFYIFATMFSTVGMVTFSYNYLDLDKHMPFWRKALKIILPIFAGSGIISGVLFVMLIGEAQSGSQTPLIAVPAGLLLFTFGLMVFFFLVLLPIWGIYTYRKNYSPAKYFLIATFCLILGFVLPFAIMPFAETIRALGFQLGDVNPTLIEGGIALQLCMFALAVGHKRNLLEKEKLHALEENLLMQQKVNAATDRFVPYEFLKTLGRESIMDVHLGDQVEKNVTVFFSDIRDYTSLSEQMTPQQNFIFLNAYLGRVAPVIKTNRGFVNQFYGDGVMALFMSDENGILSQQDGVLAAMEMHRELKRYNSERLEKGRDPIRIGVGIHNGPLMMGVLGDEKRMDVGVVSDTVNTAARLEGLTKYYGSTTIISGNTFEALTDKDVFQYRPLGQVQMKGKKRPIALYDMYDGDVSQVFDQKAASQELYLEGYEAYFAQQFKAAVKAFKTVLTIFPDDPASQYFMEKAKIYARDGVGEDWTGIEVIRWK